MTRSKLDVQIGTPLDTLPSEASRTTPPARHWLKVAEHARTNEGHWLPVRVGHLTVDRHRQAAYDIRHRKIVAFRDAGFEAAFRDGTLYVRYVEPVQAAGVTRIKRAAVPAKASLKVEVA